MHFRTTKTDCPWCKWNSVTGSGSGIPEEGKDWTSHPNYKSPLICPNCLNRGRIETANTSTITCMVEDKNDYKIVEGKLGKVDDGIKLMIGDYSDIQAGTSFKDNLLYTTTKIVVGGIDYVLKSVKPYELLDIFGFEAEIQRRDKIDLPDSNVQTS